MFGTIKAWNKNGAALNKFDLIVVNINKEYVTDRFQISFFL